jgi:hypothetical protein
MKRPTLFFVLPALLLALALAGCARQQWADNAQAAAPEGSTASTPPPFNSADKDSAKSGGLISKMLPSSSVTIPAGTPITVRLQTSLSSNSSATGQQFDAVLDEPLVVDNKTVAPKGTPVVGRVVAARSSGRLHDSGYLRLALASISVDGKLVPVQSSSMLFRGGSHKQRNWAMIGGGTAAGALIGGLAGGGKGALIGSAVGAGGGTATAYATGKKDVALSSERRLSFRLLQPLNVKS